jgi:hypothetical protein
MLDGRDVLDVDLLALGEFRRHAAAALGRVAFDEIGVDAPINRRIAAGRRRRRRRVQKLLRARIELLLRDVAIGDEIAGDAAEPLLVIAIFEIVERIK